MFHLTKNRGRRDPVTVRLIEYRTADGREPAEPFRLVTSITDHTEASAIELAAAYAQLWEIESAFDELNTRKRGPRAVLRSKSPELVILEICGHRCCHYATRTVILEAALPKGRDPDRISLVAALRISPGPSPSTKHLLTQRTPSNGSDAAPSVNFVRRLLLYRRSRSNPCVVKRKYTKWHVKRSHHEGWTQPCRLPETPGLVMRPGPAEHSPPASASATPQATVWGRNPPPPA